MDTTNCSRMETIHMSTYTLSVHNAHTCVHYTHSNTCIYTSYIHVYIHSMCTTVHNVQTTYTCYTYTLGTIHMHTYVYKSHTFVMYEILDKCAHNTYTRIHILKWVRQTQTGLMISQKEPCHFNVVTAWSALWHRYWHTNISSYYYLLYWHICHQLIFNNDTHTYMHVNSWSCHKHNNETDHDNKQTSRVHKTDYYTVCVLHQSVFPAHQLHMIT